jgi:hypothetical protein
VFPQHPSEPLLIFIAISGLIILIRLIYLARAYQYKNTIYLRDGRIIKGKIIKQSSNNLTKVRTKSNEIFVFKSEEIEKIIPKEKEGLFSK